MKHSSAAYSFLLAIVPVLSLVAKYPGQASLDDLATILILILAGCAVIYAVTAFIARRRWHGKLPALAVLLAVLWFYVYNDVANHLGRIFGPARHYVLVPTGLALTVTLAALLLRKPGWLDRIATFLTLVGVLLVAQFSVRILWSRYQSQQRLGHSRLVRALARPVTTSADFRSASPRRDVYLILLDEYANAAVTRERFGFDNHVFEDSLRQLGFFIPPVEESNYLHTTLSLPSLLNAAHLLQLTADAGPDNSDPTIPNYLVEHNRTARFLRSQGYRFHFFPSQWWLSTRHNGEADNEFQAWPSLSARELSHTELRRKLRLISILDQFQLDLSDDYDHLVQTFAGIRRVAERSDTTPAFVFAHVLNPHDPFIFDEHCEPRRRRVAQDGGHRGATLRGYAGQLQCLDGLVLRLVDSLMAHSRVPPVILLQGDHGTKTLHASVERSVSRIAPAAARERFGAFGAYYLPDGGSKAFSDTVTVVNVMGNVLRYYFGADLPREPDNLYVSVRSKLFLFKHVEPSWLVSDRTISREPAVVAAPAESRRR